LCSLANVPEWAGVQFITVVVRLAGTLIVKYKLAHLWAIVSAVNTIERMTIFHGYISVVITWLLFIPLERVCFVAVPPCFIQLWFK